MECTIRPARPEDAQAVLRLIDALAEYEHLEPPDEQARNRLLEHGFGPQPRFQSLLVESGGQAVGYALYFYTYSTFLARPSLYLEDIFILPDWREHRFGSALMRRLAQEALDQGCGRMEWQVLHWNQPAIDFYQRLGAKQLIEWLPYRLTRDDIERLADLELASG